MAEIVADKERRKMRARRSRDRGIWYGLGMFGMIGWSIALPTVIGIAVGIWIDRTWHPPYSCTLACLFAGVAIGCAVAWYWIGRETSEAEDAGDPSEGPDSSNPGQT